MQRGCSLNIEFMRRSHNTLGPWALPLCSRHTQKNITRKTWDKRQICQDPKGNVAGLHTLGFASKMRSGDQASGQS